MKKIILTSLFFAITLIVSCNIENENLPKEQRSFCYWDTQFELDTSLFNSINIGHFYVRFFDVDWDYDTESPKPIATIQQQYGSSYVENFTPTVFFTNNVFKKCSKKQLDDLSNKVINRIKRVGIGKEWNEILIDCDWTETTETNYFYFLKKLQEKCTDKNITSTLRLWQYKRNKTSQIPPVSRCLLMCYNMNALNDINIKNSIASISELKKYVSGNKYPLPLDIALPIFGWSVLFRNNSYLGLLRENIATFENDLISYKNIGKGKYLSITDRVLDNYYIRKGDIIRCENVSAEELIEMANYLKNENIIDNISKITYFSFNKDYINNYGKEKINEIYNIFSE